MARARSPSSIEAEKLFHEGMKLVDIAKKLGVPEGTVRRWKSTQKWDVGNAQKKNEHSEKKTTSVRNKRGAPKGNKNAVGNKGGPLKPGDKIAEKHGAYSSAYWDSLDEDELRMVAELTDDEEVMLLEQIQLFSVRERRIMHAINGYRKREETEILYSCTKVENQRTFATAEDKEEYERRIAEKIENRERLPGELYQLTTQTENKDNMIARLEKELSTIQSKKTKAIDSLARLRLEKKKMAGETKGNEVVKAWADAVLKARRESNGRS